MNTLKKVVFLLLIVILAFTGLTACKKDGASKDGKVEIEFFQYKTEARGTFDKLIAKFEKENPEIRVVQSNPPDAMTVLKTRIAKRDMPDVIGMGADVTLKELVDAKALADMSDSPALDGIQPAYVQMVKDVSGAKEVYGIPYATNAVGVIYNKKMFKEMGLKVPQTWDELIATADKVKKTGKIPFYFTFKDAWTTLPSYNVLAANTQGEDFFEKLHAGETSFSKGHQEAANKYLKLLEYGHKNQNGKAYNDGNTAFANGESAMYLQGIWAIPEIKKANPNIELGVFPFPVTNKPGESKVVSGVDLLLATATTTEHPEEAKKFIEFLTTDKVAKEYLAQQNAFSAKQGLVQKDPSVEGLKESFKKGAVVDFPDHYVPSAVGLDKLLQEFVKKQDSKAYLKKIDAEWEKVADRK
ncbi:extracellular solute-binding protein [Bacillus sp. CLL-7-23]|uniref:Extracellular solute-binding protein n=1 Tax=Bacillus changyiensis TaxID=3004103 RepID=A0ABT4X3K9_9BACI|nr:extracellular solute-binding protein [Bacillus changyiensis]MDA7026844.1 extracellular solute-binding protein [Bacillus changyiensis]